MNISTTIGLLRIVAILEGISYLLFAVTMPLKYSLDIIWPNKIVGMAHGVLFLLYIILCAMAIQKYKWKPLVSFLVLAASLFPFATFVADHKVFKKVEG